MGSTYVWNSPETVVFGPGVVDELGTRVGRFDVDRALIVTDEGVRSVGIAQRVVESLATAGIDAAVFDGVKPDPTDETVHRAADAYAEADADGIVAVGGGSSIDAAKGASIIASNGGHVLDCEGYDEVDQPTPPTAYVPTTAGTGSEVSHWCIITNTKTDVKEEIGDLELLADIALVDPELTASAPPTVRAAAGMDALTHAVESFVSIRAQPHTDALALDAVRLVGRFLTSAVESRDPPEAALTGMAQASMQAGVAFNGAGNCAVHALAHQVGSMFGVPHGVANAILLPYVMEYNALVVGEELAQLAAALEGRDAPKRGPDAGTEAVNAVCRLRDAVRIPETLAETSAERSAIGKMADRAMDDGCIPNNPRRASHDDLEELLRRAFDGELRYGSVLSD